jgi:ABC-type multidrug transport system fused ATPase/permease subunit
VVFLVDGAVRDQGTHEELLSRQPAYAALVNAYEEVTA